MGNLLSGGKKLMESTVTHARNFSKEFSESNLLNKMDTDLIDKVNPINLFKNRAASLTNNFKNVTNSNLYSI